MSKIKDWKQITTGTGFLHTRCKWFKMSKIKDWKQITTADWDPTSLIKWFKMSKIKDWKQITTTTSNHYLLIEWFKMSKIKDWKQITTGSIVVFVGSQWFKMSKIKDWKQITTSSLVAPSFHPVVQDVKDQRLKANHNQSDLLTMFGISGSRCQRSKIESKSQLVFPLVLHWLWCQRSKIESKSQQQRMQLMLTWQWFKMSKIKDWKQITTHLRPQVPQVRVVQDVKDQRLKANHNQWATMAAKWLSGSRCQRSKIESKSQHWCLQLSKERKWFKMSKIKDWKQITTWNE